MTKDERLFKRALDVLDWAHDVFGLEEEGIATKTALRDRLAQPEQEPVAWADMDVRGEDKGLSWTPGHFHKTPLYTTPPQRKPLTDDEADEFVRRFARYELIRAIEAAHGIKGGV